MIFDLENTPDALPTTVDICIAGSGPAGLSLALRLMQNQPNLNIAVLEGGGREPTQFSQALYEGESIGMRQHPLHTSRSRVFGGTSNIWSGWCNPLMPADFEAKAWIDDSGWPIRYENLMPYYQSAYDFFGVSHEGNVADNNFARYPALKKLDRLRARALLMHHSYPAVNVGHKYEPVLAKERNVSLYLNANLTRVNLTKDGSSVSSLTVTHNNQQRSWSISANNYVLACGGIENPRLLLASHAVHPNGVGNDRDCVGRYFIDHLHSWNAVVREFKGHRSANYLKKSRYGNQRVTLGITPSTHQQQEKQLANAVAYFSKFDDSFSDPWHQQLQAARTLKKQLQRRQLNGETVKNAIRALRNLDSLIAMLGRKATNQRRSAGNGTTRQAVRRPMKKALTLTMYAEQTPNRSSRVQLSQEKDKLGMPKPVLNWQLSEQDHRSMRQSTLIIAGELAKANVGRLQLHRWLADEQSNWPSYFTSSRHHMGATRMSSNRQTGVVDADCRVHGLANLYIGGSSVFPTGGYANPTLTIVALAQRLADHLTKQT